MIYDLPPKLWTPPAIIMPTKHNLKNSSFFAPALAPNLSMRMDPVIKRLGLKSGLKLILDAGDSSSYASGQSWLDRSGGGYDFFLGATSGSEASDPTFNGTAGTIGAYWSFDGGDYFKYDSANETWMENLHKDNAKFSIATWIYIGTAATVQYFCGNAGSAAGHTGIRFGYTASNQSLLEILNNGANPLAQFTTATFGAGAWTFLGISLDEAVGANGLLMQINSTQETYTSTYTSPASGASSFTLEIASRGNASLPLTNTSRMAAFCMWESAALTAAQMLALYQATRRRFGV